jgi:hypothetical protein
VSAWELWTWVSISVLVVVPVVVFGWFLRDVAQWTGRRERRGGDGPGSDGTG